MPDKTILILANSVRHLPNACVAGREILDRRGRRSFGGWVRPISAHGEGELSRQERWTAQGREVRVLDIVRMPLGDPVPDVLQPENWRVVSRPPWEVVGSATLADLELAAETPPDIWDTPNEAGDRVSTVRVTAAPLVQSLWLIRVDSLTLRLSSANYPEGTRKHRRAIFRYGTRVYNLAITDPTVEARYGLRVPTPSETAVQYRIGHPCYVCVSLALKAIRGHHYKLIAAIIDPEQI